MDEEPSTSVSLALDVNLDRSQDMGRVEDLGACIWVRWELEVGCREPKLPSRLRQPLYFCTRSECAQCLLCWLQPKWCQTAEFGWKHDICLASVGGMVEEGQQVLEGDGSQMDRQYRAEEGITL